MPDRDGPAAYDFGAFVPGAHHIELASGRYLDLAAPDPMVIELEDIAHGLSHTCRFAGHCSRFYSVAEHALLVVHRLRVTGAPPHVQLSGLHHDDAEAFVGDVTRPLKALIPAYADIEAAVMRAIAAALDLGLASPLSGYQAVKDADDWALACEAYHLLPSEGATWFCADLVGPRAPSLLPLGIGDPDTARRAFLHQHRALAEEVRDA